MFEKLFRRQKTAVDSYAEAETINIAQVEEIFEYGRLKDLVGIGTTIRWRDKPKPLKNMPVVLPPHFQWSANPRFAYLVVLENGELAYHYSENGDSRLDLCPVTTSSKHIRFINEQFKALYEELGLPDSLLKLQEAKQKKKAKSDVPKDKMDLLKAYIESRSDGFFMDELSGRDDILMWVDWREEDAAIVHYCETVLHTGTLTAEDNDSDDYIGFEIIICYKGARHKVPYAGNGADRDTTLITLNEVLQPDYEIRLCRATWGSDTLAFLPLSAEQWRELESACGQDSMDSCFSKITAGTKLFG